MHQEFRCFPKCCKAGITISPRSRAPQPSLWGSASQAATFKAGASLFLWQSTVDRSKAMMLSCYSFQESEILGPKLFFRTTKPSSSRTKGHTCCAKLHQVCILISAAHPLSVTWGLDHFLEGAVPIWRKTEDETKPRVLSLMGVLVIYEKHTPSCAVLPKNCHSHILWKVECLTMRTVIVFSRLLSVFTRLVPSRGWNKRMIKQKHCGSFLSKRLLRLGQFWLSGTLFVRKAHVIRYPQGQETTDQ